MCWKCGTNIEAEFISRGAECPVCRADLHSCRNCEFYSEGSRYDCRETVDGLVRDKERSNFCDSFRARRNFSRAAGGMSSEEARKKFDSLFSI